jgi:hypothetical protein
MALSGESAMFVFWLCACAYLIVSTITLLEADIRPKPGSSAGPLRICWVSLRFGLYYPALAGIRRLFERS